MTSTAVPQTLSATRITTWNIDPAHSVAEFKVRHMMISYVRGEFSGVSGVLKLDESDYTRSTIVAAIPVASVKTVDEKLDAHLKNADFFDAENFPIIAFKSTSVRSVGGSDYSVAGDLTIHGITNSVTLNVKDLSKPAKDPWGNLRIGLSASTKINRKDFGIVWNTALDSGGVLVGDEVVVTLDVQFIKE